MSEGNERFFACHMGQKTALRLGINAEAESVSSLKAACTRKSSVPSFPESVIIRITGI